MTERAHDERIRTLELHHAATVVRLDHVETQQRQMREDLTRVSRESRDELHALRGQQRADTERLLMAINANKIAWSMMSSGTRVAAWILLALASVAGAISGIMVAVKRFLV